MVPAGAMGAPGRQGSAAMEYTVGEAARLGGVSVRTLHHYEAIGLLVPSARSGADYRLYDEAALDRLARILYYRELGFPLAEIGVLLGDGAVQDWADGAADGRVGDAAEHLDRQRKLLTERLARTAAMLAAIDRERTALTMGKPLTAAEKLEIFGPDYDPAWEAEAEQRWGGSEAWRQSAERNRQRGKEDWQRLKDETADWNRRAAEAMVSGVSPSDPAAAALAEEHRAMIAQHYDCSYAMHRQLADMYVADPRFAKNYDDVAPGLAAWVRAAIHANADLHPDEQGRGF